MAQPLAFARSNEKEPHLARARAILVAHPELKALCGHTPVTALFVLALVGTMVGLAALMADSALVGDGGRGLAGGRDPDPRPVGPDPRVHPQPGLRAARAPTPCCSSSRTCPSSSRRPSASASTTCSTTATRVIPSWTRTWPAAGRRGWWATPFFGKAFWLFNFWIFQAAACVALQAREAAGTAGTWRTGRCRWPSPPAVVWFLGWGALAYLFLSSIFAIGLHPVGARWVQEHYTGRRARRRPTATTAPSNVVAFNVGYHNEHHDVMRVPWLRLPKVRAMAPEFYADLQHHTLLDAPVAAVPLRPRLSLYSRMMRGGNAAAKLDAPPEHTEPLMAAGSGSRRAPPDSRGHERSPGPLLLLQDAASTFSSEERAPAMQLVAPEAEAPELARVRPAASTRRSRRTRSRTAPRSSRTTSSSRCSRFLFFLVTLVAYLPLGPGAVDMLMERRRAPDARRRAALLREHLEVAGG